MPESNRSVGRIFTLTTRPGQPKRFIDKPVPISMPVYGNAPTAADLYGSNTVVKASSVGYSSELESKAPDPRKLAEKKNRCTIVDLYMFANNRVDTSQCVVASKRDGVASGDALMELFVKETKSRGKMLQNRLVGMPSDGWRLESIQWDSHWLLLFVIAQVQAYDMKAHLNNLKRAHAEMRRTGASLAQETAVVAEHTRLYQAWRATLVLEKNKLEGECQKGLMASSPKRRMGAQSSGDTDAAVSKARHAALPASIARVDRLITWLDATHGRGIPPQSTDGHAEDIPHPWPSYAELQDRARIAMWTSACGEDEICYFYKSLNQTVALLENLRSAAFGKQMEMSMHFACMSTYQDFALPRLRELQQADQAQQRPCLAIANKFSPFFSSNADEIRETFRMVPNLAKHKTVSLGDVLVPPAIAHMGAPRTPSKKKAKVEKQTKSWAGAY